MATATRQVFGSAEMESAWDLEALSIAIAMEVAGLHDLLQMICQEEPELYVIRPKFSIFSGAHLSNGTLSVATLLIQLSPEEHILILLSCPRMRTLFCGFE